MGSDALNMLAIALTLTSILSGFAAIGRSEWWDFPSGASEYAKGNSRAWLYGIVAVSTILSVFHLTLMIDWAVSNTNEEIGEPRAMVRLIFHCLVASVFIALHFWVREHRKKRNGQPDRYLWGNGHGAP